MDMKVHYFPFANYFRRCGGWVTFPRGKAAQVMNKQFASGTF